MTYVRMLIVAVLMLPLSGYAQKSVTITNLVAGTLSQRIANENIYLIGELTLSGSLNGTDVNVLREMAGMGQTTIGILEKLVLTDCRIVKGGVSKEGYVTETDKISNGMFRRSTLREIHLPKGITTIEAEAFLACTSLRKVVTYKELTTIELYAFSDCSALREINFEEGLTTIGELAFGDCTSLTSLTFPSTLSEIQHAAFRRCTSLKSLTFLSSGVLFSSFWRLYSSSAFNGCSNILDIYVHATRPYDIVSNTPFASVSKSNCIIHVPKGYAATYRSAAGWSVFNNIVEMDITAIASVSSEGVKEVSRYDAEGRLLQAPTKGLNIVIMSDGTRKKEFVK